MTIFSVIDIGSSKTTVLVAQSYEDGRYDIIGVGVAESKGVKRGVIVDVNSATNSIQEAVTKAERTAGVEIVSAFVNLSGKHADSLNNSGVVGINDNRAIDEEDIDRALDSARAISVAYDREVVHIIPRGFTVDGQDGVKSPLNMHGFRLEVEAHIITASTAAMQNVAQCVNEANIDIVGTILSPLASAQSVLTETEREMGIMVCDIGEGTTDIAVYIEGSIWHSRVLDIGGERITGDIMMGLQVDQVSAEQLKKQYGHAVRNEVSPSEKFIASPLGSDRMQEYSRARLAEIVEARTEEIFVMVQREIKRAGYDNLLSAGIVLTGGTAQLSGVSSVAKRVLNLPARVAEPQKMTGLVERIQGPAFATSSGMVDWVATYYGGETTKTRRRKSAPVSKRSEQGSTINKWLERFLP